MIARVTTYSAVRDDALGDHDLVDLLERLRRREVSAAELTSAARARAHDAQRVINAVVTFDDDASPAAAAGPLAGIPTFVKDNEDVAGLPTLDGSRAMPTRPASRDSAFVEVYRGLGLTLLGKSTMPEFGLTASTEPLLTGPTRNPWDLDRTVGGSSGGACALVAAGVVPMAHANDGGGSIRIPAACCGLVGLKPSAGRLPPPENSRSLPVQIVSQGVVTRSVRDTATFLAEAELVYAPLPRIGFVAGPSSRRLRIGVVEEGLTGPVSAEVAAATEATAALLAELGHEVAAIPLPVHPKFGRDFLRYWAALAFSLRLGGKRLFGPEFDPTLMEPFTQGLCDYFRIVGPGAPASVVRLRRFAQQYARTFDTIDVVLSPTVGYAPPPLGHLSPDLDFDTHIRRLLPFAGFTAVQNVAGTPAISLPLGRTPDGVPIGVQLTSAFGDERTLLELAYELETAAGWPTMPPAEG